VIKVKEGTARLTAVVVIFLIIVVGAWSVVTLFGEPPEEQNPFLHRGNLKITVVHDEGVPGAPVFLNVNVTISGVYIDDEGYELGPRIERFDLHRSSFEGTRYDGESNLQYSLELLDILHRNYELKVVIYFPGEPWELVVQDLDGDVLHWTDIPEFSTGPLEGEETWGYFWRHHTVMCTGIPYDVYFELGPRIYW
jgi:hypothetical protein